MATICTLCIHCVYSSVNMLACKNSPDLAFKPFASLGLLTCILQMSTVQRCIWQCQHKHDIQPLPVLHMLLDCESIVCLQPSVLSCQVLCHQTSHWHGSIQVTVDPPVVHGRIPVKWHAHLLYWNGAGYTGKELGKLGRSEGNKAGTWHEIIILG